MAIDKHPRCAQPSRWSWRRCDPQGVVIHDIVCPPTWTRDQHARLLLDGVRQANGRLLPPPIYHFVIDSSGDGWRLAENASKANHVGPCDPNALARLKTGARWPEGWSPSQRGTKLTNGNRHTLGIGLGHDGRTPASAAMIATLVDLLASLCRDHQWSAQRVVGHRELTTRKVDPGRLDMHWLRSLVDARLAGRPAPTGELPAARPGPPPTLTVGYEGRHILAAQDRLVECGLLADQSGAFDRRTERAIRIYQRCHWLAADGVIGPKTWRALTSPDER